MSSDRKNSKYAVIDYIKLIMIFNIIIIALLKLID